MRTLLLALALAIPAHAAIPAFSVWQVSTGGSDTNGGFFITGSSGTDRSTNDAAFCTATDLVLVTSTTATSATCPFSAASVGNGIYVSAGTGFTVQFCAVTAVVVATATLQCVAATAGTGGSTGGSFSLGGRLLTVGKNLTSIPPNDTKTCIKTGTYTITAELSPGTVVTPNGATWEGFGTTCGDLGTPPTITSATNSIDIWAFNSAVNLVFRNMTVSSTAGTRGNCFTASHTPGIDKLTLDSVTIDGCNIGVYGDFNVIWSIGNLVLINTTIKNCVSHGVHNSGSTHVISSYIKSNGGSGLKFNPVAGFDAKADVTSQNSVYYANSIGIDIAVLDGTAAYIIGNDVTDSTNSGIKVTTTANRASGVFQNNVLYANGAYGLDATAPTDQVGFLVSYNASGANVTAAYHNVTSSGGDVTSISDPFVDRTNNNFALTAAGITAIGSAGYPGATGFGTGHAAIGALQPSASGGSANFGVVQ